LATKNILITGASGLIGQRLTELLVQKGYHVSHLGRKARAGTIPSYTWNVASKTMDARALQNTDAIIHLAGAGIADKPWTPQRKQEILESRTHSTRLLFNELARQNHAVKTVIAASAIGYYGFGGSDEVFTEASQPGTDFLASVTQQWEAETDTLQQLNLRVAKIRIGIVLSEKGGALKPMLVPVKLFVGSPLGTGQQYMSWIHIDDLCHLFIDAIENEQMAGAYNGVAAVPTTNSAFTKAIAEVLQRPLWLPNVPAVVIKLLLGEMAALVLQGSRVSAQKVLHTGFRFRYPELKDALRHLLQR
jgi:uncharacterized protein